MARIFQINEFSFITTYSSKPNTFNFEAWFLPGVLQMGGTDDKVQNSPSINKSQDFWGCTFLKWSLHLKMRIYLIFNLLHRCMHTFLFSNPNSFQLHTSLRKNSSIARQLSLPHCSDLLPSLPYAVLPCLKCLPVSPNPPLLTSSFLCYPDSVTL